MKQDSAVRSSRRRLLASAGGLAAAVGAGFTARSDVPQAASNKARDATEPFWGLHQAGIVTPAQAHTYFAAFDLTTGKRDDVVALLQSWTAAAARMTAGQLVAPVASDTKEPSGNNRIRLEADHCGGFSYESADPILAE